MQQEVFDMEVIDLAVWERRQIFETFSRCGWPFYSLTIPVDVTAVRAASKAGGLSFYYTMVWLCVKAVNAVPEFRLRIRSGQVVRLDWTEPSFTVLKPDSESFQIVTMPWQEDLAAFCARAKERAARQSAFLNQSNESDGLIYLSCTPWFDFTALTNERSLDPDDTIPRLAWGRYYEDRGRLWIHLSIDVNHRTIDGLHIGQLKAALDREIAGLEDAL